MSIFNQNLKSPLEVKVEWVRNSSTPPLTLSISALMLNKEDVINRLEDFVFYGTPNNGSDIISSDKSVTCDALNFEKGFGTESSYKMNLELGKVSNTIDRINIVVSINTKANDTHLPAFDSLTKATFSIKDAAGLTFTAELNNIGESFCRCITIGLVRRWGVFWRFEEEMDIKLGGLELVYNEFMNKTILCTNPFSKVGDLSFIENTYRKNVIESEVKQELENIKSLLLQNDLKKARNLSLELQKKSYRICNCSLCDVDKLVDEIYRKCVEELRIKYAEIAKLKQNKDYKNVLGKIDNFKRIVIGYSIQNFDEKINRLEAKVHDSIQKDKNVHKMSDAWVLLRSKKYREAKRAFASDGDSLMAQVCTRIILLERKEKHNELAKEEEEELTDMYKKYQINN